MKQKLKEKGIALTLISTSLLFPLSSFAAGLATDAWEMPTSQWDYKKKDLIDSDPATRMIATEHLSSKTGFPKNQLNNANRLHFLASKSGNLNDKSEKKLNEILGSVDKDSRVILFASNSSSDSYGRDNAIDMITKKISEKKPFFFLPVSSHIDLRNDNHVRIEVWILK